MRLPASAHGYYSQARNSHQTACALIIAKGASSRAFPSHSGQRLRSTFPSLLSKHSPPPFLPPEIETGHTEHGDDLSERKRGERQAFTQNRPLGLLNQGRGLRHNFVVVFPFVFYGGGSKPDRAPEEREVAPPIHREQAQGATSFNHLFGITRASRSKQRSKTEPWSRDAPRRGGTGSRS